MTDSGVKANDRKITPAIITCLGDHEVFVFGSNKEGMHIGGAARDAQDLFGAEWGVGEGFTGRCYALPTMSGWEELEDAAERFIEAARSHPEFTFLLTSVGCGIAGYRAEHVAPLFFDVPENVTLPIDFARLRAERTSS